MVDKEPELYIGLIHHPIYNKKKERITTTITNLDLHDISRAARTYDVEKYYVVNHLKSQQALVKRMIQYWTSDYGAKYNPNRQEAFSLLEIANTLDDVIDRIKKKSGKKPRLIATDARPYPNTRSYRDVRDMIFSTSAPFLLIFGTGWGLTEDTIKRCDYMLEPVYGRGSFNHLSVRSAASIILDRLLSPVWWQK